jgi:hypothetical protein
VTRRGVQAWLAGLSLAAVLLVAVSDAERVSPGSLALVHGRADELDGGDDCSACHGGWFSSMNESCVECHAPIGEQLEAQAGLHGILQPDLARTCALCHAEHHGSGFALVNGQSFALAGVSDPEAFDHARIGWVMDGAHLELDCAECHVHARTVVLPEGEPRFLGLDQGCATCHEDPHEGRMAIECASCHGQSKWDGWASLGHERFLPLVGGHAEVACLDCHAEGERDSLERLGMAAERPKGRACTDCHESPHFEPFVVAIAERSASERDATCVVCHAAGHTSFRDERLTLSAEDHAASGFALVEQLDEVACVDCHAPAAESFAERYPGRGADACAACHEDPHGGQFATGPFAAEGCIACHERGRFEPHAFTVEDHALASLALDGAHLEVDCETCHEVPGEQEPRVFRGTPSTCDVCHPDAHGAFFDARVAREQQGPPEPHGACALCHLTTRFDELPDERFDHGRWTGFPVLGAHAATGCEACHAPSAERDEHGRSFGRVAENFGPYVGCETCHADPHGTSFERAGLPRAIEGRSGCARCHVESSFRAFHDGFDHRRWTGFALAGAHGTIGCAACHAPLAAPDEVERTSARARGPLCADCHADPHARQFERAGRTDCERCHTDEARDFLAFDHERDARFALGEAHRRLACDACHMTEAAPQGKAVVRYRPLPTQCVDCHGVHEEVLLSRKRGSQR